MRLNRGDIFLQTPPLALQYHYPQNSYQQQHALWRIASCHHSLCADKNLIYPSVTFFA